MKTKALIFLSSAVLVGIVWVTFFSFQNKPKAPKPLVNPYVNALNFTAQIDDINIFTRIISVTQLPTPLNPKKTKYEFKVADDTAYIPHALQIPYLFKSQPEVKKLGFGDLKVGQTISVTTKGIKSSTRMDEALSFQFPPRSKLINGKIVKIDQNTITVVEINMLPPALAATTPETPRQYKVTINNDTEISRMKGSTPEKLDLSFLKKDTSVQVFYEDEAVTALLIRPQEMILPPT